MKSIQNRVIAFIMAVLIAVFGMMPASVVSVQAATTNPQSLEELFDAQFYAYKYPEVASVVGTDEKALYNHFVTYGLNEGKTCSALLNVGQYRANYSDVATVHDHHWDDIVKHYFTVGITEGRKSFVSPEDIAVRNALLAGADADSQINNSVILQSIDNAIDDAADSSSGYIKDSETGIIASADGYALIPYKMIEKEGRIQDIDELIKRCGSDLILIRDHKDRIKFVGGKFSNVKVTNEQSAIQALDTMANLYDNGDDRRYLKLNDIGSDSLGNPFYRFVTVNAATGIPDSNYTVTLSVDSEGNVLGASNANSSSQFNYGQITELKENWDEATKAIYENSEYKRLFAEPKMIYDADLKCYLWALYYEKDGIVTEVLINTGNGETVSAKKHYDAETFHNNPSESFNRDYEFKNLKKATTKDFINFYGEKITLPVAYEEGKGWYIVDTERKMLCVQATSDEAKKQRDSGNNMFEKHYFSDDYFKAVANYMKDGTESDLIYDETIIITAFNTLQHSYDESKKMGMLPTNKAIYVNFIYNDYSDNAAQLTSQDVIFFTVYNNNGNADFAGMAHEFGHSVVANQGQYIPYQAATGAINESYADIIGSLLKMIKKKEGKYAGNVDFARWLIGEFLGNDTDHVIRNMSNPLLNKLEGPSPLAVNDKYFIKDTGVYTNDENGNDLGGVHQNNSILSHICYRMYNEVFADRDANGMGIPDENKYRDLLKVWHDSVLFINYDTTYADIKGYILQAMKNHGYTAEQIEKTESIFNDANVDAYVPFEKDQANDKKFDETDLAEAARVAAKAEGFDELRNYVEGEVKVEDALLDYEIAYYDYELALMNGASDAELMEYKSSLEAAYNTLYLSEKYADELEIAFKDSQTRLKSMIDSKMDIIKNQEKELKQVAKEKESNPNLESSYKALKKSVINNVVQVDKIIDVVEEAATEFKELDEIFNTFSDTWGIDATDLIDDEGLGYPDEMPEDLYIGGDYPEGLSEWDYYDYWDDFWDAYWEDDYDFWYGNFQDFDEDYNYFDENYSDQDYFRDLYYGGFDFDDFDWDDFDFDWSDFDFDDEDWYFGDDSGFYSGDDGGSFDGGVGSPDDGAVG